MPPAVGLDSTDRANVGDGTLTSDVQTDEVALDTRHAPWARSPPAPPSCRDDVAGEVPGARVATPDLFLPCPGTSMPTLLGRGVEPSRARPTRLPMTRCPDPPSRYTPASILPAMMLQSPAQPAGDDPSPMVDAAPSLTRMPVPLGGGAHPVEGRPDAIAHDLVATPSTQDDGGTGEPTQDEATHGRLGAEEAKSIAVSVRTIEIHPATDRAVTSRPGRPFQRWPGACHGH